MDMKKIDLKIRALRKAKGWNLDDLASRIGVSTAHLSEMERGLKNVNGHRMEQIAHALGVEPFDLIQSDQVERERSFASIMSDLDEHDQAKVAGYAESLLAQAKEKKQT